MKNKITDFDLAAAFKALDEISTPVTTEGRCKRNEIDLKEAFKRPTLGSKTDALMEEFYDVPDELPKAKDDMNDEIAKAKLAKIEKIVDLDADSPEEILPSYEGKIIVQCPQCMTLFYKNAEDIEKSEDDDSICNVGEKCQHCGNEDGYTIIGKVAAAEPEQTSDMSGEEQPEAETEQQVEDNAETEEPAENSEDTEEENLDDLDLVEPEDTNSDEEEEEEDSNKKEESLSTYGDILNEDKLSASEIKQRLDRFADTLEDDGIEENLTEDKNNVSDAEFKELINSKIWNEGLDEDLNITNSDVDTLVDEIKHAGESEEAEDVSITDEAISPEEYKKITEDLNQVDAAMDELLSQIEHAGETAETPEEDSDTVEEALTCDPEEIKDRLDQFEDDLDFDEIDDKNFNEQFTSYLRKIYRNVDSFKTTGCSMTEGKQLTLTGKVKFNSGKEKTISIIGESCRIPNTNKYQSVWLSESLPGFKMSTCSALTESRVLKIDGTTQMNEAGGLRGLGKAIGNAAKKIGVGAGRFVNDTAHLENEDVYQELKKKFDHFRVIGWNADRTFDETHKKDFDLSAADLTNAQQYAEELSKLGEAKGTKAVIYLINLEHNSTAKPTNDTCVYIYYKTKCVKNNYDNIIKNMRAQIKMKDIGATSKEETDLNNVTDTPKASEQTQQADATKLTAPIEGIHKLQCDEIMTKGKEAGNSERSLKGLCTRLKKLGLAENVKL